MKAVFATLSLAALAVAVPQSVSQCNTDGRAQKCIGNTSCCNSVQDSASTIVQQVESLLGIALGSLTGQVGFGCTPITAVGLGTGANCDQQPVCCAGNEFGGLIHHTFEQINVGCTPLTL
ncbi:hypothetical protein Clacol_005893 [Clathrus columnatus]|uniref:Hydrophobin n=1 Tax=Clathrus columnatus TaxID=1419009 RepID=A0AAV5AAK4_9AGAM|nr:hypothetical protein Clacol_005893 [Clathrus columnatus]